MEYPLNIQLLSWLNPILILIIGYFIKRILDKIDRMSDDITELKIDMADIKPKVNLLWEHHIKQIGLKQ